LAENVLNQQEIGQDLAAIPRHVGSIGGLRNLQEQDADDAREAQRVNTKNSAEIEIQTQPDRFGPVQRQHENQRRVYKEEKHTDMAQIIQRNIPNPGRETERRPTLIRNSNRWPRKTDKTAMARSRSRFRNSELEE